ncbi:dihydroxy-acid dehydratase, partial [Pseudomonas sp.]|uniref:dihydroxy-acid dehydratase domain-containing protein n=1 Tax=Pseudomonas sp. TaxID=306 RepID=UPI00262BCB95
WQRIGEDVPLLVNCMPAGKYLGEGFHRAGGVPAVMHELQKAGRLHEHCASVSGKTIGEIVRSTVASDVDVIYPYEAPLKHGAGFIVLSGNFFDSAIMKMSVVGDAFRKTYLSEPGAENTFEARAIVFEGPEDYHARINDPALEIDERCILVIRGVGNVGYPGSAEVVNMAPPSELIKKGIDSLPCLGDGRQSGTSASPSILNMSPEAAVGGGLALLRTNDRLRVDLNTRSVNVLVSDEEMAERRRAWQPSYPASQTPWQELYRQLVGQLSTGGCLEPATLHLRVIARSGGEPRHSH